MRPSALAPATWWSTSPSARTSSGLSVLPEGDLRIGITSGASTPDRVVEGVIDRLLQLAEAGQIAAEIA